MRRPFNPRNHRTWPACLSCARVAKILGFRPATVRDMARRGLLPVVPHTGSDTDHHQRVGAEAAAGGRVGGGGARAAGGGAE
jgi:hypothetical protein